MGACTASGTMRAVLQTSMLTDRCQSPSVPVLDMCANWLKDASMCLTPTSQAPQPQANQSKPDQRLSFYLVNAAEVMKTLSVPLCGILCVIFHFCMRTYFTSCLSFFLFFPPTSSNLTWASLCPRRGVHEPVRPLAFIQASISPPPVLFFLSLFFCYTSLALHISPGENRPV